MTRASRPATFLPAMATIRPTTPADHAGIHALLASANLPVEGVDAPHTHSWVAMKDGRLAGVIALEVYSDAGFLRSVAVAPNFQNQGIGTALVRHLLTESVGLGVQTLYLLTLTAEQWFPRFGFRLVPQGDVDPRVRQSPEFRGVCPESARTMVIGPQAVPQFTSESFRNVYADTLRADAYATLEFPATYGLAFRDLPELFKRHVTGSRALDFGCGAGRSTRFLQRAGFDTVGVDIAEEMLERARVRDPGGRYHRIPDTGVALPREEHRPFDLVLSAFAFDNIPTAERKVDILQSIRRILAPGTGRFVNLVSAPEIYLHEWVSFSTRDFPRNRYARSGETVRIVMLDVDDHRPVEDVLCTEDDYRAVHQAAGLRTVEVHRPLGQEEDGVTWKTEREVSPWAIHVLAPLDAGENS